MATEHARAKINLTLHVGRAIADMADPFYGYHPLDSLVVFADIADELSCEPADTTSLHISGPFGGNLPLDDNNLILRAVRIVERLTPCPPLRFSLVKNLPVAAGIGGGSANAAAALRLLKPHVRLTDTQWHDVTMNISADVPVCFTSQTARMTGLGETVHTVPNLGWTWAVLANPNIAVSTLEIFKAFDAKNARGTPRPQRDMSTMTGAFRAGKNDLQPIAIDQSPIIQDVLTALSDLSGIEDVRMSGSGATCFALCPNEQTARDLNAAMSAHHPEWWCTVTRLGDFA